MMKVAATRNTIPRMARKRPIFVLLSMPECVAELEVGGAFG